jgi:TRAP-type C4-dicarboxylate transport system permease small subunit
MDDPISRVVEPVARVAAIVCGYAVLLLSVAVSVEIVGRKLFSHSFPGTDDIGGYVLAIVAIVGASYTMAKRGHTRVDIFLVRMPTAWQRVLNLLAMVSMAAFAIFAAWRGSTVLLESIEFQSVASNPLQTPLWQPQSLWLIGLVLFALISGAYAVHALLLFVKGDPKLNRFYGPASVQDELEAELTAQAERAAQEEEQQGKKPS